MGIWHDRQPPERGSTLTGYSLLVAAFAVVSLGAIAGLNDSSESFLTQTGADIGAPRESTELLTNGVSSGTSNPVPLPNSLLNPPTGPVSNGTTAPPSQPLPPGFTASPSVSYQQGYSTPPPDLDPSDGSPYRSDTVLFMFNEGGGAPAVPIPNQVVTPTPALVCSMYLSYTPENDGDLFDISVTVPGPIVGYAATDSDLTATDEWLGAGSPAGGQDFRNGRAFESNEISRINITGSTLLVSELFAVNSNTDDMRLFYDCT